MLNRFVIVYEETQLVVKRVEPREPIKRPGLYNVVILVSTPLIWILISSDSIFSIWAIWHIPRRQLRVFPIKVNRSHLPKRLCDSPPKVSLHGTPLLQSSSSTCEPGKSLNYSLLRSTWKTAEKVKKNYIRAINATPHYDIFKLRYLLFNH